MEIQIGLDIVSSRAGKTAAGQIGKQWMGLWREFFPGAEKPRHGDIVVASVQGEFTVKRLLLTPRLTLQPMNASWSPIYPDPDELDIFGVVTHIIHRPREMY
ncbi:Protein impA [Klebsiella variicola]|nr:Protein impA [Klebsiella variicola]